MTDECLLFIELLFHNLERIFGTGLQDVPLRLCFNELVRDLSDCMNVSVFFRAVDAIESLVCVVDALSVKADIEDAIPSATALGGILYPVFIEDGSLDDFHSCRCS
jgi:hypothetical protein